MNVSAHLPAVLRNPTRLIIHTPSQSNRAIRAEDFSSQIEKPSPKTLVKIIASTHSAFSRSRTRVAAATSLLSLLFSTTPSKALSSIMAPSVRVIPNDKLYVSEPEPQWFGNTGNAVDDPSWTNENWLKSRFHFSFAEYNNFGNMNFGKIRVLNDDLVQPHRGFGTHPHANMEIITYVVDGELTHADSMGTMESLGRGSIQFMTAGTGVRHSEANAGDKPLRFIQTWVMPSKSGLKPNYGSYRGDPNLRKNQLHHLVSNVKDESVNTPVAVNQDVNAYASELNEGAKIVHELAEGRQAYLLCIEGGVKVNGASLAKYDACEITGGGALEIEAAQVEETEHGKVAHILMFEMAEEGGAGRTDF